MKFKSIIIRSVMAAILFAAIFGVGRASATTGCFNDTNSHWAESFICWMKDNGISGGYPDGGYHPNANVTRAEMAVFLKAQAEIPPSTGDIYVSVGPTNWVADADTQGSIEYRPIYASLNSPSSGNYKFLVQPVLPVGLYGRQMSLKGVRLCYSASSPFPDGPSLVQVSLIHRTGGVSSTLAGQITDPTTRTDSTCREYDMAPAPTPLKGTDLITLSITAHFPDSFDQIDIYETVFILTPGTPSSVLGMPLPDGSQP